MLLKLNEEVAFCADANCKAVIEQGTQVNCINTTLHGRSKRASDEGVQIQFDVSDNLVKKYYPSLFSTNSTHRTRR